MESGASPSHSKGNAALAGKFLVTSANLTAFVSKDNLLQTGGTMEADNVI